jgi:hypothetical protein
MTSRDLPSLFLDDALLQLRELKEQADHAVAPIGEMTGRISEAGSSQQNRALSDLGAVTRRDPRHGTCDPSHGAD